MGKDDLSKLVASTEAGQQKDEGNRHRISRVVVLHNDKLETFMNPTSSSDGEAFSEGNLRMEGAGEFFDNDSFWSGSLTWY